MEKHTINAEFPLFGHFEYTEWDPDNDDSYKLTGRVSSAQLDRIRFSAKAKGDDGDLFCEVHDDSAGAEFDWSQYKADILEGYVEALTALLKKKAPELARVFSIRSPTSFKRNVAICTITKMEADVEFEPDKVVPALTEFKNKRPKVWQDILKRIKGMFTSCDGFASFYTNDTNRWERMLFDAETWLPDWEVKEHEPEPSFVLGLILELAAFGGEPERGGNPAAESVQSDISFAEYSKYGSDQVQHCLPLFKDKYDFRMFRDPDPDA